MGLGKTFMTLAGVDAWQHIMRQKKGDDFIFKPILVVAPVVLLENWKDEVDKVFVKSPFFDIVILQSDGDLKRFKSSTPNDTEHSFALKVGKIYGPNRLDVQKRLVLTNYDTLRKYQFSFAAIDWGCVVFDEAQAIKNPNAMASRAAKGLKADFRLAVTGTPVENDLIDFWNIFDTVYPNVLGTCQNFREKYIKPILETNGREDVRRQVGQQLRSDVADYMLRRTKEDNLKGLPKKNIYVGVQIDGINLTPMMQGQQLAIYDSVVFEVVRAKNSGENLQEIVLRALRKMRDISLHPNLVDGKALPLFNNKKDALKFIEQSAKLKVLLEILNKIKSRNEKVIIFVINKKLQYCLSCVLSLILKLSNVPIINGDTVAVQKNNGKETRKQILEKFQNQEGFGVIIMSPLAAGVGLTVVGANNVVHLERHWNPAKEAQATDRVYRIGQKRDVNIYIPILEHPSRLSFDRNLEQLLQRKIDLKDAVVTPGEINPTDFNADALFG